MSLRNIHVLFITVSAMLAIFCAGWAGTNYRADQGTGYLVAALAGIAGAAGLAAYARAFVRKTRGMS